MIQTTRCKLQMILMQSQDVGRCRKFCSDSNEDFFFLLESFKCLALKTRMMRHYRSTTDCGAKVEKVE